MNQEQNTNTADGGHSELNDELDRPTRKPALKNWDWKKAVQRNIGSPTWKAKQNNDVPNAMLRIAKSAH